MRRTLVALALAGALGLVPGPAADAGGKGAVKTDLLLAYYPDDRPPSEVVLPEVDVGNVVLNTTTDGQVDILVQLKDAVPGVTYKAFAVPLTTWGPEVEQAEVTANRFGKGTVRFTRTNRNTTDDPVEITVVVRKEIGDPPSRADWIVYKTRAQFLRLK